MIPEIYGRDGSLVRIKAMDEDSKFARIQTVYDGEEEWYAPKKYIKQIGDTVVFDKAIFVDRHNQNIATLEHVGSKWLVRSMNLRLPDSIVLLMRRKPRWECMFSKKKKSRMIYLVDGSKETGGFAPYANRFTNGAYIHGVPVNAPRKSLIEYSPSLGTTPRSHMCVRNATSHAQFVYDWAPVNETIVFVLE